MAIYEKVVCEATDCDREQLIEVGKDRQAVAKKLNGWYLLFLTMPPAVDGACPFCSAACLAKWSAEQAALEAKEQAD